MEDIKIKIIFYLKNIPYKYLRRTYHHHLKIVIIGNFFCEMDTIPLDCWSCPLFSHGRLVKRMGKYCGNRDFSVTQFSTKNVTFVLSPLVLLPFCSFIRVEVRNEIIHDNKITLNQWPLPCTLPLLLEAC